MTQTPAAYIEARDTGRRSGANKAFKGFRIIKASIILNGERRWVRESWNCEILADQFRALVPDIDHVIIWDGTILDTGALSLGEAIEASAF